MKGIIFGFGNMGQTHYARYVKLGIEIAGVVENEPSKIETAHSFGLKCYFDLESVPWVSSVDFIDICTPSYLHFEHLQKAMSFDKAILIEKPVVLTQGEVDKLRKTKYAYPIFVGEVEQFNPSLLGFVNYSGSPIEITINRKVNLNFFLKGTKPWFLDEKLSGGIVLDLMIHDINLVVCKYGKPLKVSAVGFSKKFGVIDEVSAVLEYKKFKVNLFSTWVSADETKPIKCEVKIVDNHKKETKWLCDNYAVRALPLKQDAFHCELGSFLESVESGKVPFSLSSYLDAIEIGLEIKKKMKL